MMPELYLADALGAAGKPLFRVHTAGSVGGSTAIVAAQLVQAGIHERVLTVAFEKQSESEAMWALSLPIPFQPPMHAGAGGYFAPHIRSYMRRSKAPDHIGILVALKDRLNALEEPVRPPARARHHVRVDQGLDHAVGPDPLRRDVPVVRRRLRDGARPSEAGDAAAAPAARRRGSTARRCAASRRCRPTATPCCPSAAPSAPRDVYKQAGITDPRARDRLRRDLRAVLVVRADVAREPRLRRAGRGLEDGRGRRHADGRRPAGQHERRRAVVEPDRRVGHAPLRRGGHAGAGPGRRAPGRRGPSSPSATPTAAARSSSPCGWSKPTNPSSSTVRAMALAHSAGPTDVPLLDETIGDNLAATARRVPGADAVVSRHQDVRMTYAELDAAVDQLAGALLGSGLAVGDRVGIWSPNCAEWILVQYATARAGVILVNVNPAYRTSELAYALEQSGCRWLIAAPAFKTSDYRAIVDEVRPGLPALERVVFLDTADWDELVADAAGAAADVAPGRPDQHPVHERHHRLPEGRNAHAPQHPQQRVLRGGAVRLHRRRPGVHPGALLPLLRDGAREPGLHHPRRRAWWCPAPAFEPLATLEAVEAERCTSLYGVPTMFIAELDHPDFERFDLTTLRTGIMAGSPCPVEVMKQVVSRMHMDEVTICYGMTETSPVSTQTEADDTLDKRVGTVGRVHPHVEVRVVDPETGATVERDVPGELCTRGYSVMQGYWNDPERTAEAIDADGWMHTGDLATMDEDGYLNIVGRIKDMVIRGGENIYPREIEEFLYTHPDVGRRPGDRRARRPLRRGAHGVGEAAGGRAAHRGRAARVLPRPHRALQGAALRPLRRRVPDDGHRQGPEVQDAGGGDRRARPGGRGTHRVRPKRRVVGGETPETEHYPWVTRLLLSLHADGRFENVAEILVEPRYGFVGRIKYRYRRAFSTMTQPDSGRESRRRSGAVAEWPQSWRRGGGGGLGRGLVGAVGPPRRREHGALVADAARRRTAPPTCGTS